MIVWWKLESISAWTVITSESIVAYLVAASFIDATLIYIWKAKATSWAGINEMSLTLWLIGIDLSYMLLFEITVQILLA